MKCLVPGIQIGIYQGMEFYCREGPQWPSQKDASMIETRLFPNSSHSRLYLQTFLKQFFFPLVIAQKAKIWADVEWGVAAFWRLCLNQAGGSPGSVFRMSSIQLDLFCGLKGETESCPQSFTAHLMVQSGRLLFSPLTLALLLADYGPKRRSCCYVTTFRDQFSRRVDFSTI